MFIRVVTGIRDHFEERVVEWVMGAALIWWGSRLIGANDAWTNREAWAGMLWWMPENAWGWNCMGLGAARLIALAINGTFSDTAYGRFSPMVRSLSATLGGIFWFLVVLSVSAVATSGSGIYPLPLVLEVWCVLHAWRDTGRAWDIKHARH